MFVFIFLLCFSSFLSLSLFIPHFLPILYRLITSHPVRISFFFFFFFCCFSPHPPLLTPLTGPLPFFSPPPPPLPFFAPSSLSAVPVVFQLTTLCPPLHCLWLPCRIHSFTFSLSLSFSLPLSPFISLSLSLSHTRSLFLSLFLLSFFVFHTFSLFLLSLSFFLFFLTCPSSRHHTILSSSSCHPLSLHLSLHLFLTTSLPPSLSLFISLSPPACVPMAAARGTRRIPGASSLHYLNS